MNSGAMIGWRRAWISVEDWVAAFVDCGARIGWRRAWIAVRGLGLARSSVLDWIGVFWIRLMDLAIGLDSSVALDWICTVLDWIGGEMADSGMPWGGGVKLDCGGGLAGALRRIPDGVGRWIGWGDGHCQLELDAI